MSRRLHISAYNLGGLHAFEAMLNSEIFLKKASKLNIYSIIGGQFIQSGVSKIYSFDSSTPNNSKLSLLVDKVQYYKTSNYFEIAEKVNALLKFYIPTYDESKNKNQDDEIDKIYSLGVYLIELFFSTKYNTSFPIIVSIPVLEEYKSIIPLELYKPLEFLFSCIKIEDANLPLMKRVVNEADIKNFQHVVESKSYSEYCKSHLELDHAKNKLRKVIRNVEINGNALYNKHSKVLSINNTMVSTLNFSAKLVDFFAGKLPGTLADFVAKLFTDALKKDQRVVMYDCTKTIHEITLDRIAQVSK